MAPRRNYTSHQMGQAMEAVKKGLSVGHAAKKYGVPRITLRNKVTGKSPACCPMGPTTVLSPQEENVLKEWIFAAAERHFPISKEQLLDSVQKIIINSNRNNPFTNNRPGKKWYYAFLRRHPDIAERVAQNLITSRDAVTETQINCWFTEIDNYIKSRGLEEVLSDPRRVYNTDESAFFLNPKPGKVLAKKGDKNIYATSGNEKENLTVLLTANAAGDMAPPMIVFAYERVPTNIANSIPDSYGIGKSDTGWMCSDTFYEYICNIFHPWLLQNKITLPVIFFLDGHRSHLTVQLSDFCSKNGIEVIALYPNSTHILQPMDIAVFRPLKTFWKNEVRKWKTENLGHQVKKENFGPILEAALKNITKECIKNGFKAGGLCPFGPEHIDFSKLSSKNRIVTELKDQASLEQNTQFLKNLESEISKIFTYRKLILFKKIFFMPRSNLENELPNEDLSLYVIWAKYRNMCVSASLPTDTGNQEGNTSTQQVQGTSANSDKSNEHGNTVTSKPIQDNSANYSGMRRNELSPQKSADVSSDSPSLVSKKYTENTPGKCVPSVSSDTSTGYTPKNIIIPSPFKNALFWPEPIKKKGKINKEKLPSAITSEAWKQYHERKELQKKALEQEKEKRKLDRLQKKKEKEEIKQAKKELSKKKRGKISNKNQAKRRKVSISSDDVTDSDVTYVETGDSESDSEDNEIAFLSECNKRKRGEYGMNANQDEMAAEMTVVDEVLTHEIIVCANEKTVNENEIEVVVEDEVVADEMIVHEDKMLEDKIVFEKMAVEDMSTKIVIDEIEAEKMGDRCEGIVQESSLDNITEEQLENKRIKLTSENGFNMKEENQEKKCEKMELHKTKIGILRTHNTAGRQKDKLLSHNMDGEQKMMMVTENRDEKQETQNKKNGKENDKVLTQKDHKEKENPLNKKDRKQEQEEKAKILSNVSVQMILDEQTGKMKLMPTSTEELLAVKSNGSLKLTETSKQYVLAKFKSKNGKRTFQYVCRIEESYPNDKMVVQGLKSKKCKKVFKLVKNDLSIIDVNDVITYLPQPIVQDDCFVFTDCVNVTEQ